MAVDERAIGSLPDGQRRRSIVVGRTTALAFSAMPGPSQRRDDCLSEVRHSRDRQLSGVDQAP